MEIRQTLLALVGRTGTAPQGGQPLPPLQPGQRLEAWVTARQSATQVVLQVEGKKLVAETALPLRAGDRLLLEVVDNRGKMPQLKILEQGASTARLTLQTLRSALPKQEPLIQALRFLAATRGTEPAPPGSVTDRLAALIATLPQRSDLIHPERLQQAIRQSGLFYEASLSHPSPSTPAPGSLDLKLQLLQLARLIGRTPTGVFPQNRSPSTSPARREEPLAPPGADPAAKALEESVSAKVSAALSRLVLNQLASLPAPEHPGLLWHLELPLRSGGRLEPFKLTVKEERTKTAAGRSSPQWSVWVEMASPRLGSLRIKLTLRRNQVSAYLWSESPRTRALFQRHLKTLDRNLRARGLETDRIQTIQAPPQSPPPLPVSDKPLVDESI